MVSVHLFFFFNFLQDFKKSSKIGIAQLNRFYFNPNKYTVIYYFNFFYYGMIDEVENLCIFFEIFSQLNIFKEMDFNFIFMPHQENIM